MLKEAQIRIPITVKATSKLESLTRSLRRHNARSPRRGAARDLSHSVVWVGADTRWSAARVGAFAGDLESSDWMKERPISGDRWGAKSTMKKYTDLPRRPNCFTKKAVGSV